MVDINPNSIEDPRLNKRTKLETEGLYVQDLEWYLILSGTANSKDDLKQHIEYLDSSQVDPNNYPKKEIIDMAFKVVEGEYKAIIQLEEAQKLLKTKTKFSTNGFNSDIELKELLTNYKDYIRNEVNALIRSSEGVDNTFFVLILAISLLSSFIQEGWTGPQIDLEDFDLLPSEFQIGSKEKLKSVLLDELSVDGEEVYHLTPKLLLLWLSLALFNSLDEIENSSLVSIDWWFARAELTHQKLLDNPTGTLQEKITSLMKKAQDRLPNPRHESEINPNENLKTQQVQEVNARFQIEFGLVDHMFFNEREALIKYTSAQNFTGLKWKLTGALGKRTKFQQNDITQLVLWAKSRGEGEQVVNSSIEVKETNKVPETLDLNDDTLLERIQFSDKASNIKDDEVDLINITKLNTLDQTILLALCLNIKNSNPAAGLTREEMVPYVTRVLDNPNNWMVHTMGLILRSRLEGFKTRTIERSVFQLQALIDQFNDIDSHASERMQYFYNIILPSKWELEKELAEKFMGLGVIKSAKEIFEKLEMIEQVIECFKLLEQPEKALELIDTQLEKNPNSPKYLCLKGDVTKDPTWWERSWEASNERFGRAMRSLGSYYYQLQEYTQSRDCYLKALKINPLFENSWFVCGCASMQIEDWKTALQCFQRVTSIDPEQGEAWNNLASCFIKLSKKPEAIVAFQQALKLSPKNWKVWTNLLFTSMDLGYFHLAIRAFAKIVELRWQTSKDECVDIEILGLLIQSVITDLEDGQGNPSSKHASSLEKLLDLITCNITSNPDIWLQKAKFYSNGIKRDPFKALDSHIKAYRAILNHPELLNNYEIFSKCSRTALELVDAYSNFGPQIIQNENGAEDLVCKDWLYQSKVMLRSLIKRTEDSFETEPEHDLLIKALKELE